MYRTIISCRELATLLDDPNLVVIDTRSDLFDAEKGGRQFRESHIPGARFADLNGDLSDASDKSRGRHPLPGTHEFVAKAGAWGIDPLVQVVVYDQADGMYASRLWWLLRYFGHDAVAVLDGGFARWVAENRPVEVEIRNPARRVFEPAIRSEMLVSIDGVEAIRNDVSRVLIDSRAPERFSGEVEPIDPVAGHIPGAVNYPEKRTVGEAGLMRPAADLRADFESLLGELSPDRAVFYCGSGVTACHNLLAMEYAGLHGAKLYAGSWSEWCHDASRPVATGDGGKKSIG